MAIADDARRADTPETNGVAILATHAAIEAILGLVSGIREDRRGEEVPFKTLLGDAAGNVPMSSDLIDDLKAANRARNGFVHAAAAIDAEEVRRAIVAARELAERVPNVVAIPSGEVETVAEAVADIIGVEAVGMWLRHAEAMRRQGRLRLAADGLARALDGALARAEPGLARTDRRLSSRVQIDELRRASALGSSGSGMDRAFAGSIERLERWVVPMALGVSPAGYAAVRAVVGREMAADFGGAPQPVDRPSADAPSESDVVRAAANVAEMIFRLWATGSLRAGQSDTRVVELARSFIANPSGIAAGERAVVPS